MPKGESLCYADTVCHDLHQRFITSPVEVPIIWIYDIACNHMCHIRVRFFYDVICTQNDIYYRQILYLTHRTYPSVQLCTFTAMTVSVTAVTIHDLHSRQARVIMNHAREQTACFQFTLETSSTSRNWTYPARNGW